MAISFDKAMGIHPEALNFRVQRSKIIASNLANVNTPNYLAKDLSFETIMSKAPVGRVEQAQKSIISEVLYRIPYQNSQDGNTVELNVEQAKFAQNSMDFQTSLSFLNMKINGLTKAIKARLKWLLMIYIILLVQR